MNNLTYYYRFEPIAIDVSSEKEIKKYNQQLVSFADLSQQLDKMRYAFQNEEKDRCDIIINVLPNTYGVVEFAVYHELKRKLFSRQVKTNRFSMCLSKFDCDGMLSLYDLATDNFFEVAKLLQDFVENGVAPDLSHWDCTYIG